MLSASEVEKRISLSLVSFLVEDRPCLGSGTLISINGIRGIVTAAHVVEQLDNLSVGVVTYNKRPHAGRLRINMNHVQSIVLGSSPWGEYGPDLAFLKLPDTENFDAYGCRFLNLDTRYAKSSVNVDRFWIAGAVDQWTTSTKLPFRVQTTALVSEVRVVGSREEAPYDYIEVAPVGDSLPSSYEGLSGGGLFLTNKSEGRADVDIFGVVFYQSPINRNGRTITCHFYDSIHSALRKEISK